MSLSDAATAPQPPPEAPDAAAAALSSPLTNREATRLAAEVEKHAQRVGTQLSVIAHVPMPFLPLLPHAASLAATLAVEGVVAVVVALWRWQSSDSRPMPLDINRMLLVAQNVAARDAAARVAASIEKKSRTG